MQRLKIYIFHANNYKILIEKELEFIGKNENMIRKYAVIPNNLIGV